MLPPGMSIDARPGKHVGWAKHLLFSVLTIRVFDTLQFSNYKGKYWPTVVLTRPDGEVFVLFAEDHWDDALAKRDRLRDEAAVMAFDAWCDRYVVPAAFVEGAPNGLSG